MYFVNIIFNKVGNATEVRIEYPQSQETNTKALRGKGHDVCTLASNDPEKQGVGMSIYKYIHMRQICIFIDKQGMYANRIKGLQRCMASHVFFVLFYFFQSSLYRFFFLIFKKSVIDFQCCTTVQQSDQVTHIYIHISFFFFFVFCLFRATPTAHGGSQDRSPIGAVAAGLHHSHSNKGSELSLQPTPQLIATPDP